MLPRQRKCTLLLSGMYKWTNNQGIFERSSLLLIDAIDVISYFMMITILTLPLMGCSVLAGLSLHRYGDLCLRSNIAD